jgi:hypothetical protein
MSMSTDDFGDGEPKLAFSSSAAMGPEMLSWMLSGSSSWLEKVFSISIRRTTLVGPRRLACNDKVKKWGEVDLGACL